MIQAMTMVLDFAPSHWTTGTRLVALALADRVNGDGHCWPALADIARRCGMSERQVRRHIRQLEDDGALTNLGQRPGKAGPSSNLWKWNLLITLPQGADIHDRAGRTPTSSRS